MAPSMGMVEIHCMQGRLLPPEGDRIQAFPREGWAEELPRARAAGIDGIEWIYEVYGEDTNPLATDDGVARLHELCAEHGVKVESLCADWFMDRPLVDESRRVDPAGVDKLAWLVTRCAAAGIRRVVLPFVDAAELRGARAAAAAAEAIAAVTDVLAATGVELHLETSLDPGGFARLLEAVDHPLVRANYDTGNSASLGYDPAEELAAYGSRIGSVHVKDRVAGGGTVPLGHGDADLERVFALLQAAGWERPLVLQVARAQTGREVETTRAHAEYVRELWARVGAEAWT